MNREKRRMEQELWIRLHLDFCLEKIIYGSMEKEVWKPIIWYEWLYEVSNFWNVKSLNYSRTWKERLLKNCIVNWYFVVSLGKNKKFYQKSCHRLKWISFVPNPENKPRINHRDGNKLNNGFHDDWNDNLEWSTISENVMHAYRVLWRINPSKWKFWKENPKYISYHIRTTE